MNCARCGASLDDDGSECSSCGMPTVFMGPAEPGDRVFEPEVLESLDDVDGPGSRGQREPQVHVRPLGCTLGPGCGCVGLPLMVLAGVVVSSFIALLWVLNLGRLPASLVQLAARARRGFTG
jgi:hypothetical protein